MPQTMCSLCVDKINDFYEFREMCYATNAQTRKLLGLKNIKKPVPDVKPKVEIKEEEPIIPKPTGKGLKTISTTPAKGLITPKGPLTAKGPLAGKGPLTPKGSIISKGPITAKGAIPAKAPITAKGPITIKGLKSGISPVVAPKLIARDTRKRKQEEPEEIVARESRKRKQEEPPLPPPTLPKKEPTLPAVSNKKLRLAAPPLKEAATKKAKQKSKDDAKEVEVKKEEM